MPGLSVITARLLPFITRSSFLKPKIFIFFVGLEGLEFWNLIETNGSNVHFLKRVFCFKKSTGVGEVLLYEVIFSRVS